MCALHACFHPRPRNSLTSTPPTAPTDPADCPRPTGVLQYTTRPQLLSTARGPPAYCSTPPALNFYRRVSSVPCTSVPPGANQSHDVPSLLRTEALQEGPTPCCHRQPGAVVHQRVKHTGASRPRARLRDDCFLLKLISNNRLPNQKEQTTLVPSLP